MDSILKSIIKSYLRGVIVAITPLVAMGVTNQWAYIAAILAGVISPALRALDKKDPAFGLVADIADLEIDKLAKKSAKKAPAKKTK
jgi:hypothetical protein